MRYKNSRRLMGYVCPECLNCAKDKRTIVKCIKGHSKNSITNLENRFIYECRKCGGLIDYRHGVENCLNCTELSDTGIQPKLVKPRKGA